MGTLPLPFQVQLELTRPWWLLGLAVAAGPGLLLLPQPGRFRPMAAGACRSGCAGRWWSCCPGPGGPEPGPADPRAVRRLRRGPERERRRAGKRGRRRLPGKAAPHAGTNRFAVLPFAAEPGSVRDGAEAVKEIEKPAACRARPKHSVDRPRARRRSRPTPRGSIARGPTWPRRWRWRRRRSRRSTSPGSCCSPTATPPTGDALKAAAALRGKVEVLTVPLPAATEPEVQLSAVTAPAQVLQGEPFNVEVLIDSNHDDDQGQRRGLSRRHQGRRPAGQAQEGREPRRPQADDRRWAD